MEILKSMNLFKTQLLIKSFRTIMPPPPSWLILFFSLTLKSSAWSSMIKNPSKIAMQCFVRHLILKQRHHHAWPSVGVGAVKNIIFLHHLNVSFELHHIVYHFDDRHLYRHHDPPWDMKRTVCNVKSSSWPRPRYIPDFKTLWSSVTGLCLPTLWWWPRRRVSPGYAG